MSFIVLTSACSAEPRRLEPEGWKPVEFHDIEFLVPSDWQIFNVGETCPIDKPAVYVGDSPRQCRAINPNESPDQMWLYSLKKPGVRLGVRSPSPVVLGGERAEVETHPESIANRITVVFPDANLGVELRYGSNDRIARMILKTLKRLR